MMIRIDMTTGEVEISGQAQESTAITRPEVTPLTPAVREQPLPPDDRQPDDAVIAGLDIDALIDRQN